MQAAKQKRNVSFRPPDSAFSFEDMEPTMHHVVLLSRPLKPQYVLREEMRQARKLPNSPVPHTDVAVGHFSR
jgi:hypothetical protein